MAQVGSGKVGTPDSSYTIQQSGETIETKVGFAKTGASYAGGNISLYKVFSRARCSAYFNFKISSYLRIGLIYTYLINGSYFDYALHFFYSITGNPRSFFYRSFSCLSYVSKELSARIKSKGTVCFYPNFRVKLTGYVKANYNTIYKISSTTKRTILKSYKVIGIGKSFFYRLIPVMGRSKASFSTIFSAFGHISGLASSIYSINSSLKQNVYSVFKAISSVTTYSIFNNIKVSGRILVLFLISTLSKRANKPTSEGLTLFNDAENSGERRVRK